MIKKGRAKPRTAPRTARERTDDTLWVRGGADRDDAKPPLWYSVALDCSRRTAAILRTMIMNDSSGLDAFATLIYGTPVTVRAFKYDGREYRQWRAQYVAPLAGGAVLEAIFTAVVEGRTPFFGGDRAVEYFYTARGYNVIAGYAPDGALRAC